jgi:hypothetical protein
VEQNSYIQCGVWAIQVATDIQIGSGRLYRLSPQKLAAYNRTTILTSLRNVAIIKNAYFRRTDHGINMAQSKTWFVLAAVFLNLGYENTCSEICQLKNKTIIS